MSEDVEDARRALESLKIDDHSALGSAKFERLGGTTNRVFMVTGLPRPYVLRIPGKGTEAYIDRRVEIVAARAAAEAGISPEVVAVTDSGVMLSAAVENAVTMTPEKFAAIPGSVARAGKTLRALHQSGQTFDFRFELFSMIDEYLRVLATKNTQFPDGYHQALQSASNVRQALNKHPLPLAPCHCDPLCENFLDEGHRMWLVDWEYSGMNDPLWDVGDFAVEAMLTPENEKVLLASYFEKAPTPAEYGRYVIYKAMCDLLWTLWGLIQHADQNPADDFWAYANNRFNRCRRLTESKEFGDHIAAVEAGV